MDISIPVTFDSRLKNVLTTLEQKQLKRLVKSFETLEYVNYAEISYADLDSDGTPYNAFIGNTRNQLNDVKTNFTNYLVKLGFTQCKMQIPTAESYTYSDALPDAYNLTIDIDKSTFRLQVYLMASTATYTQSPDAERIVLTGIKLADFASTSNPGKAILTSILSKLRKEHGGHVADNSPYRYKSLANLDHFAFEDRMV